MVALIAFAVLSAYAWWFHVAVGPTPGAGAEIGIIAGALTLICVVAAVTLDRKGRA